MILEPKTYQLPQSKPSFRHVSYFKELQLWRSQANYITLLQYGQPHKKKYPAIKPFLIKHYVFLYFNETFAEIILFLFFLLQ